MKHPPQMNVALTAKVAGKRILYSHEHHKAVPCIGCVHCVGECVEPQPLFRKFAKHGAYEFQCILVSISLRKSFVLLTKPPNVQTCNRKFHPPPTD